MSRRDNREPLRSLLATVAAYVALIASIAFVGAIVAGFVKADPTTGSPYRSMVRFEVGETVPVAITRDGKVPTAGLAPVPTTGYRP
jgi:hypothetical protein